MVQFQLSVESFPLCVQVSEESHSRERARQEEKEVKEEETTTLKLILQVQHQFLLQVNHYSSSCDMFPFLVQESHTEEEHLRSAMKEENLSTVREEVQKERGELEELRNRAKALERRRVEMLEELQEARQEKEKGEEERREAEVRWRSRVEEMEEEQEVKLKALATEIQTLKEKHEEMERKWRSRVEEREREVAAMLEEQKTQTSSLAIERAREEEDEQRRRDKETDGMKRGRAEVKGEKETQLQTVKVPDFLFPEEQEQQISLLQRNEELRRLLRQRETEVKKELQFVCVRSIIDHIFILPKEKKFNFLFLLYLCILNHIC